MLKEAGGIHDSGGSGGFYVTEELGELDEVVGE
jgi:hypothetical protein